MISMCTRIDFAQEMKNSRDKPRREKKNELYIRIEGQPI
jgi:hypothetical protein